MAPPPYESAHQSFGIVDNNVNTTIEYASYKIASFPKKLLKPWKAMRYMALVELILAVGFIIFGSACLGTSVTALSRPGNHHVGYCLEASGIWVGVLCTVTGALGLGALGIPTGRRCLLVSYFVMSVISTIGCGILLIFSSIWAAISYPSYIENGSGFYLAIFIFNLILVVTSLVHCKSIKTSYDVKFK